MPALRETIPLQKSKVVKKSLEETIAFIILAAFVFGCFIWAWFDFLKDLPEAGPKIRGILFAVLPSFFILLICLRWFYQYLYFKRYFYDMDEKNIAIRKGVIAQKEIILPFSRITDVYVDQDLFDVMFGLYDVHISTPTQESGMFAHIDGVNKSGSQQLRQMILDRINREES